MFTLLVDRDCSSMEYMFAWKTGTIEHVAFYIVPDGATED
jgi:hypothetical protein